MRWTDHYPEPNRRVGYERLAAGFARLRSE